MRRFSLTIGLALAAFLLLAGCATLPRITQDTPNYLAKGMVKENLKGESFYMAVGDVNLYRPRAFGGFAPTGRTIESPVAIQVNAASGLVDRVVTLQPYVQETSTTAVGPFLWGSVVTINRTAYRLGDLIGGISIIDIHPYPTWVDAVKAMHSAVRDLGTSGNFVAPAAGSVATTYTYVPPVRFWFFWNWHSDRDRRPAPQPVPQPVPQPMPR